MYFLRSLIGNIKLAQKHKKIYIIQKRSNVGEKILRVLLKKNIIKTYILTKTFYIIFLHYVYDSLCLKDIKLVSKPGKKIYVNLYKLNSLLYKNKTAIFFIF